MTSGRPSLNIRKICAVQTPMPRTCTRRSMTSSSARAAESRAARGVRPVRVRQGSRIDASLLRDSPEPRICSSGKVRTSSAEGARRPGVSGRVATPNRLPQPPLPAAEKQSIDSDKQSAIDVRAGHSAMLGNASKRRTASAKSGSRRRKCAKARRREAASSLGIFVVTSYSSCRSGFFLRPEHAFPPTGHSRHRDPFRCASSADRRRVR